jgi:hypothetical protein
MNKHHFWFRRWPDRPIEIFIDTYYFLTHFMSSPYQQVLTKIRGLNYRLSRLKQKPGPNHDDDSVSSLLTTLTSWAQDPVSKC